MGRLTDGIIKIILVIATIMLLVPYGTGAIQYSFNTLGIQVIRPMYYLLACGCLIVTGVILNRPKLTLPALCLLALLGIRTLDAWAFDRVAVVTTALSTPATLSSGVFFFGVCLWLACGNTVAIRWASIVSAIIIVVVVAGLDIYEWRYPGTFSTVVGRSAGMLENPNVSAQTIGLALAFLAYMGLRPVLLAPLFVIGSLGAYFTLSRGGWVMLALLGVAYLIFTFRTQRRLIVTGLVVAAVVGLLASLYIDFDPLVTDANVRQRMAVFKGGGKMDIDDTGRLTLLVSGAEALLERPITGYGTSAAAERFAPHNMFIAVGLDSGFLGLLFFWGGFALFFWEAMRLRPDLFLILLPMFVAAQLSHNLLDDFVFIFCWLICSLPIKGEAFPLTPRASQVKAFFARRNPVDQGKQPRSSLPPTASQRTG